MSDDSSRRISTLREALGMMTVIELRCDGPRLHGVVDPVNMTIEVKCERRRCGHEPGTVTLHTFDLLNGFLVNSVTYNDPAKKGRPDARQRTAVRSA
jgi:hypothetical protein